MSKHSDLSQLSTEQLRALAAQLMTSLESKDRVIVHRDAVIEKLSHELATLKRHKYAQRGEQMNDLQASLLDELVEGDLAAIEIELAELSAVDAPTQAKKQPLIQAPVPAQVIDKGIPTAGLLAQVLVAKYSDHLPLYRQERIFARAGFAIPRSTLAEWVGACGLLLQPLVDALRSTLLEHNVLHADETPVSMLAPGKKKTHKAYVWAYCTTPFSDLKAVVYNFARLPTQKNHAINELLPHNWTPVIVSKVLWPDAYAESYR